MIHKGSDHRSVMARFVIPANTMKETKQSNVSSTRFQEKMRSTMQVDEKMKSGLKVPIGRTISGA